MTETSKKMNIPQDILSGITGALLLGSYALCACAVSGLGLLNAFLCICVCAVFSVKSKNKIFSPDSFLLMPVLFIIASAGEAFLPVCVAAGALICFVLRKLLPHFSVPDCVLAGASLGICLAATVMLTNDYFGIGAFGASAFEMLKTYRSLGFHPHFRGLLYGTITLFAMITYPFKFRKLNKYLPAEFITLLIPLILNLFLNPEESLTTINEVTSFGNGFSLWASPENITGTQTATAVKGSVALGLILFAYSSKKKSSELSFTGANAASGLLSGMPVREFSIFSYSPLSAVVTIVLSGAVIFLCPDLLSRIPMHSIGALLIVSGWQNVPYKYVASTFKAKRLTGLAVAVLLIAAFLFLDIFTATLICLLISFLMRRSSK